MFGPVCWVFGSAVGEIFWLRRMPPTDVEHVGFSLSTFSTRKELFRGDELSPIVIFYFLDAKRALSGGGMLADYHFLTFSTRKELF